jgi:hypothetical protein
MYIRGCFGSARYAQTVFLENPIIMAVILGAIAIFPVIRDRNETKPRRRRMLGHLICRECGYDVHASTGRCPECGFPVARPPR